MQDSEDETPPIHREQIRWSAAPSNFAENTMQSPFVQEMILSIIMAKWRKAAERTRPGQCALQLRSEVLIRPVEMD